jgi:hypothetical protein
MKRLLTRGVFFAVPLLLLALPAAAGTEPAAGKATSIRPRTLVAENGLIRAFTQDSSTIAWIDRGYNVHVRRLAAKRGSIVGEARQRGGPVAVKGRPLALAGLTALWTSYDGGNFLETHLHFGSPTTAGDPFVFYAEPGPNGGSYLGGLAGDGSTLVFGATDEKCDEPNGVNCHRLDVTGVVKRVDSEPKDVPGTPPPVMLALSQDRVAVVPAKTPRLYPDLGPPRVAEFAPVKVYDLAGHLISSVVPDGTARAIALSSPRLAVLVERVDGSKMIQLYDARTGGYFFADGEGVFSKVPVTVTRVAVGSPGAVYAVGSRIYLLRKQQPQLVWRAAGTPIGLSIEGRRIAWAENVKGRGRIVALTLH